MRNLRNVGIGLLQLAGLLALASCSGSKFDPPERLGPPILVKNGEAAQLWLLVKQEEQKQRRIGGSRSSGWTTEIQYHFDLQAHDARTADRLWKKRLLTIKDKEGGHNARARILGQQGNIVWLHLHDGPLGLSSADGSSVAERTQIEQRNPALQGVLPKEPDFYAFDDGLVITAADGRRHRLQGADHLAAPYQPVSDAHFQQAQFMATRWNGGYTTRDFLTRQATLGGRWVGLYTQEEAADAGDDGFGDSLKNPDSISMDRSGRALRTFWSARIGKTKEFSEENHDRLFDVTRIPGAPELLDAGLLLKQGARQTTDLDSVFSPQPGKQALMLENPRGVLVLHRTRLDADGRLALTRLEEALQTKWSSALPMIELRNRFESPGHLLMYGAIQVTENGATSWHELIVGLHLQTGVARGWNVTRDEAVPATELEKRK